MLGNNLQGIDYTYGINGELKAINGPTKNNDPGLDTNDAFGMAIDYFSGDYSGNGFNPGTNSITGVTDLFNGLPKAIRYHNIVDNNKTQQYAFNYDSRYQLSNARFVSGTATTLPTETAYQEQISGYDKNGNITGLKRRNGKNLLEDDFAYVYGSHANRLDKVTQNSVNYADYTYNAIGQLTKEEKANQTLNFTYNAYGLVNEIRNNSNQILQAYHYSDRGDLLRKVFYQNNNPVKQQVYVSDATGNVLAIYEQSLPNGEVNLIELPVYGSGRIATYKNAQNLYLYEVNDHLGNVRALIGAPETDTFLATMESENDEEPPFRNISNESNISNNIRWTFPTANNTPNGNEVIRLNNVLPVGPAIKLAVTPGDKIDMEAYAYYEGGSNYQNVLAASTIVNAIAGAFGGVLNAPGDPGKTYNTVSGGLNNPNMGIGGAGSATLPGAYMQFMVYDDLDQFQFGGYTRISEAANFAKEKVTRPTITIEKPGFIYIFLYNASNSANFVYWDDLKITHQHSPIVAGADYYPFGLPQAGREIKEEKYKYGYQGQYSERDSLTQFNEFELRFYDARIGRFTTVDPYGQFYSSYLGMGNNPNSLIDPSGGLVISPDHMMRISNFLNSEVANLRILVQDFSPWLNETIVRSRPWDFLDDLADMFRGKLGFMIIGKGGMNLGQQNTYGKDIVTFEWEDYEKLTKLNESYKKYGDSKFNPETRQFENKELNESISEAKDAIEKFIEFKNKYIPAIRKKVQIMRDLKDSLDKTGWRTGWLHFEVKKGDTISGTVYGKRPEWAEDWDSKSFTKKFKQK
ncbi:MAG: hypothetical protein O9340_12870 [Cyclobacteriaceae bacterium]|nr:hypothetical protein [Cyclobacteriaceae bacterium]